MIKTYIISKKLEVAIWDLEGKTHNQCQILDSNEKPIGYIDEKLTGWDWGPPTNDLVKKVAQKFPYKEGDIVTTVNSDKKYGGSGNSLAEVYSGTIESFSGLTIRRFKEALIKYSEKQE